MTFISQSSFIDIIEKLNVITKNIKKDTALVLVSIRNNDKKREISKTQAIDIETTYSISLNKEFQFISKDLAKNLLYDCIKLVLKKSNEKSKGVLGMLYNYFKYDKKKENEIKKDESTMIANSNTKEKKKIEYESLKLNMLRENEIEKRKKLSEMEIMESVRKNIVQSQE